MTLPAEPAIAASREDIAASATAIGARRGLRSAWTDSVLLTLAISLVVGLVYSLIMMGPALNPRNIGWLVGDSAMSYTGWALYRQDPHWHWPLTYTDRIGYPRGEAAALMDINALMAVLLKPFSRLLGEPFQYFGIEFALLSVLQFFLSIRLFRLLLGQNRIGIFLCSMFFLIAPPFAWDSTRTQAANNQWLLIAALIIYLHAQQESPRATRRFVISAFILVVVAVAINAYLAFQVVAALFAAAVSLLWQHRLSLSKTIAFMVGLITAFLVVAYSLGFLLAGGSGYAMPGYRHYSMNVLEPFDPYVYGSILSHLLPRFSHSIYTGLYLGAGVIVLIIIVLILFLSQSGKRPTLDRRQVLPLLACCLVLTLMAFSTRVRIGSFTLDLDPYQHFTRFLALLRMSYRLFWLPYYTLLAAVFASPFLFFRKSRANLLLAIVLVVQLVDTAPLLKWVQSRRIPSKQERWTPTQPSPLQSPVWATVSEMHENLMVLPAWQCGFMTTPGGLNGFWIFGLFAAEHKMRINSYYAGRYTKANRDFHCGQAIAAVSERPLSPDTAYVVTPAVADIIAEGPTGPGKCHPVDGFMLCSAKTDFGLGP
jgi:hypothetical protein